MIIAIDTRFLLNDHPEGYDYFLHQNIDRITRAHGEHQFIFIFHRKHNKLFSFAENVTSVIAGPSPRHPLSLKYWYDVKIPALLKKYRVDLFVSCEGLCSLTTRIPQCVVIPGLSFLHHPFLISKASLLFLKHYTPKCLERAKAIITLSEFSKKDIITQYKIEPGKIRVVPAAANLEFYPPTADEKQNIKDKLTNGKEYFIYAGPIHPRQNLVNLLKAFSIFKKKQASNLRLVLAGYVDPKYKDFTESLKTYKYREDVVITGWSNEEEKRKITGSAYAFIYPSLAEASGMAVRDAMCCHVPVITSRDSAMQETAGDSALYVDPADHNDIAEKMMLLYKDENLRSRMIEKGKTTAEQYKWERSAVLFWQYIT